MQPVRNYRVPRQFAKSKRKVLAETKEDQPRTWITSNADLWEIRITVDYVLRLNSPTCRKVRKFQLNIIRINRKLSRCHNSDAINAKFRIVRDVSANRVYKTRYSRKASINLTSRSMNVILYLSQIKKERIIFSSRMFCDKFFQPIFSSEKSIFLMLSFPKHGTKFLHFLKISMSAKREYL